MLIHDESDARKHKLRRQSVERWRARPTSAANPGAPIRANRWAGSQKIVNDDLERPRLEQVQADSEKREKEPENRLSQEWSVVAENASIDPHVEISGCRFQISD